MTEMYVTAQFIQWEGDRSGQMFLIPKVSKETMGVYDPGDDIIIVSAAAIYVDMLDDDDAWAAYFVDGNMFRPFVFSFIRTTQHELLHAVMDGALPWTYTDAECEAQFEQEEWIIDKMGWT